MGLLTFLEQPQWLSAQICNSHLKKVKFFVTDELTESNVNVEFPFRKPDNPFTVGHLVEGLKQTEYSPDDSTDTWDSIKLKDTSLQSGRQMVFCLYCKRICALETSCSNYTGPNKITSRILCIGIVFLIKNIHVIEIECSKCSSDCFLQWWLGPLRTE